MSVYLNDKEFTLKFSSNFPSIHQYFFSVCKVYIWLFPIYLLLNVKDISFDKRWIKMLTVASISWISSRKKMKLKAEIWRYFFLFPLWSGCWWFTAGTRGERDHSVPQAEASLPPHHLRRSPTISPSSRPAAGGGQTDQAAAAAAGGGGGAFLLPLLLSLPFPLRLLRPRHRDGRVWSPQCLQLPGEMIILTHSVSPHTSHFTLRTVPYLSGWVSRASPFVASSSSSSAATPTNTSR